MSSRVFRRVIALGVAAGVAAGAITALVVPTRSRGAAAPPRITVVPPRPLRHNPGELVLVPQKGTVTVELNTPDPLGGPPFAVRVFRAVRRAPSPIRGRRRPGRLLGHDLCAQLGRVYQGRFGWIDAQHRFRPARFNYEDAPIQCGDRWRDRSSDPQLTRTTLITNPLAATAAPTESVVWGIAGALTRTVTLQASGMGSKRPPVGPRGAFLAFIDPNGSPKVLAHFSYKRRPAKTLVLDPTRPTPVPPPLNRFEHGIVVGSERLEARAPDPTGGLAWGIQASRTTKGGYCLWDVGRVVGSRAGDVNYELGTVADSHVLPCLQKVQFPPKMPLAIGLNGTGSIPEPGEDPDPGHVALRTLPGRTVLSGLARPDVREITIETPRDVRTIVPSERAHAFIVVYDGTFPTGEIDFRVTFKNGTHTVQRMPALPF